MAEEKKYGNTFIPKKKEDRQRELGHLLQHHKDTPKDTKAWQKTRGGMGVLERSRNGKNNDLTKPMGS